MLLDVLTADPAFGASSRESLRQAYDAGALVGVVYEPMQQEAAELAGQLSREG